MSLENSEKDNNGIADASQEAENRIPDPVPVEQGISQISSLLRNVFLIAAAVIAIWLIGDVLIVVFASVLCAVVLNGLADILVRRVRLPYGLSLALVCLVLVLAVGGIMWTGGSDISAQLSSLQDALIKQANALRQSISGSPQGRMILQYVPMPSSSSLESIGSRIAGSMTGLLGSAFGAMGTVFVVLVAGLYFATSPKLYANGLLRLVPVGWRVQGHKVLVTSGVTLRAWLGGQALDMLVVGLATGLGLSLIGVPLALALGVMAALCNFIPYIGAIMGAVPAILIALSLGFQKTLMVVALYAVVQFLEGNVLAPLIQRKAVSMPPAIAILSQTLFGAIFGFPGLILASPLTAVLLAVGDLLTPSLDSEERIGEEGESA
ncbi:AI-2E family transporter [Acetobacter sp. AN02]|uniref:AI-2E family transporter n=1 Tax=Acetobacter sp. AN02 TaxID=2894186 RepID=UPI0024343711|nr:AI-2E family transporter [Acetobacter sp. AN02]MDG6094707.1 AI-2E family transporter [Acetobacter sp. AN02]